MKTQKRLKRITWFCISAVICCATLGCGMTHEEIVKEIEFCAKNDMHPDLSINLITGRVFKVTCIPNE